MTSEATASEAERLAALRELLPATSAGIYLDTATFGPLPAESAEAMRQADDWELRVGRVTSGREEDAAQRAAETRAVIGALIGAAPEQITLTNGLAEAARLARSAMGAGTEVVEHVSSISGERGAPPHGAILDLSNSAGAIPVSVDDLGADAVILAADRWLLGPEGAAALWLRQPTAIATAPLPRTTLVGLARSVGWLEMYVGLEWVHARTAKLAARLRNALAETSGVEVVTPDPPPAAIVSFRLPAWPADEAADELGRRVFALLRPLPEARLLGASVGWFNTEDELDRFASAVATLAPHTPETLPRRPPLVVR